METDYDDKIKADGIKQNSRAKYWNAEMEEMADEKILRRTYENIFIEKKERMDRLYINATLRCPPRVT